MKPLTTASGVPLFKPTSRPSVSTQSRVESVSSAPTGDLHLVGSVTTLADGRFEIRSEYNAAATGFFHSLPESRWVPGQSVWRCLATPLCAWMLRSVGLVIDGECAQMANRWDEAIEPPVKGSVDTSFMKMKPLPHQVAAMEFANKKYSALIAMGMGAMKTATSIGLMMNWGARTVLVFCPKSVLGVWRGEMAKHCALSHNVAVLDDGSPKDKAARAAECLRRRDSFAVSMVVVNYETSWRDAIKDVIGDFKWDLFIADESHRCADSNSIQSRFAFQVAMNSHRRLLLTGTPMENILGLFQQFKLMEPAIFGTSFSRYRSRYAITHDQYKSKILEAINQDEFLAKYKPLCFRVETLDVIDLPPLTHTNIPVTLERKTREQYKTLAKQCLLELEQGEVTAQNAGTKMIRLASMACGHLKTEDGKVVRVGSEKKEALKDFISDLPPREPIVVFCRFTEDLRQVEEIARELKRTYAEISGLRKDALTEHAKLKEGVDICGVQERAGGVGIDLTRSSRAVFFSHGYSLKDTLQAFARVHRPGQLKPSFIYHLVAEGTVDEAIMRALDAKEDVVSEVLKHIKWGGSK